MNTSTNFSIDDTATAGLSSTSTMTGTSNTEGASTWSTMQSTQTTFDGSTTADITNDLNTGAIAGIAVACTVVALLILLALIYRKKLAKLCANKHEPASYMPTAPLKKNKNKIYDETCADEEFKKLFDYKSEKPQSVGLDPKNSTKNRYRDIVPYDNNRVKLLGDGYINASHIEPYFIATQDPMLAETDPLWQMVWENNVTVIVRLSSEEEGAATDNNDGQQRCAVYIPPRRWVVGTPDGDIDLVTGEEVDRNEAFVKTQLTLTKNETRLVDHYHIQDWSDDRYPNETATWDTIKKIRSTKPSKDRKVLVHCGAGSGRTGTFIALWMLYESHGDKKDTSILDICLRLREQRPGMVTRLNQYDYIYKCAKVLEEGPLQEHV